MEYRVFSSTVAINAQGGTLYLDESQEEYAYTFKKSLVDVITTYKLQLTIEEEQQETWLYYRRPYASLKEIVVFASELLGITMKDTVAIIEYLLQEQRIDIISPQEYNMGFFSERFMRMNSFYQASAPCFNEEVSQITIPGDFNTIMLLPFDTSFYERASHPIKYLIDIIFYFMLQFARGCSLKQSRIIGKFNECPFRFTGYKDDGNIDPFVTLKKEYFIINDCSKEIKEAASLDEIKTMVEHCL